MLIHIVINIAFGLLQRCVEASIKRNVILIVKYAITHFIKNNRRVRFSLQRYVPYGIVARQTGAFADSTIYRIVSY